MARTTVAPQTPAQPTTAPSKFARSVAEYVRAGYNALYVHTPEEGRVERELQNAVEHMPKLGNGDTVPIFTWDVSAGFKGYGKSVLPQSMGSEGKMITDPIAAIKSLTHNDWPKSALFVFRELDAFFHNPPVQRALRNLCDANLLNNTVLSRPIIVTSPKAILEPRLRHCFTMVDFDLPDESQLASLFDYLAKSMRENNPSAPQCSDELREKIIANLLGLSTREAEDTVSKCLIRHGGFVPEMLRTIKDEKQGIMQKGEVLTYIHEDIIAEREQIGGYDIFLEHVARRSLAYTRVARFCKIDNPKGVILAGLPGCGKSMVALAAGKLLGLPVITMNVGAIFGSLVGESEQRMRDALRTITALRGCVLLIDEADKAWANVTDSRQDNGVTQRIFGQLLNWLAAKEDRTYVIMTMNRTKGMPPELLRKGRFDELFFVDLPTPEERQQIFEIHFRKRGLDPAALLQPDDWKSLIDATHQFSGSEIEEVVKDARFRRLYRYFQENAEKKPIPESLEAGIPDFEDILVAAKNTKPASDLYGDELEEMRQFMKDRATPVSSLSRRLSSGGQTPPLRGIRTGK